MIVNRGAPVHRVLAEPQIERGIANIDSSEHEGIEDLAGRSLVETLDLTGEAIALIAAQSIEGRVLLDVAIKAEIIPTGGADSDTIVLSIDQVDLSEYIRTIHDHIATIDAVLPLVTAGRVGQAAVAGGSTPAPCIFERAIPIQTYVRVAGVKRHGIGRSCQRQPQTTHEPTRPDDGPRMFLL